MVNLAGHLQSVRGQGIIDWGFGRVSVVPTGNPQAALLPAPLEGGDCLDVRRYGEWLVRWGVGGAYRQPPGSLAASPLGRGRLPGRGGGVWDGWCGGVSVVPAGNPQAAFAASPLEGGDCLDGGRYVGRLVRRVVGAAVGCGGAPVWQFSVPFSCKVYGTICSESFSKVYHN